jgi:hypothetical protein
LPGAEGEAHPERWMHAVDPAIGQITFSFVDITNLRTPTAGHVEGFDSKPTARRAMSRSPRVASCSEGVSTAIAGVSKMSACLNTELTKCQGHVRPDALGQPVVRTPIVRPDCKSSPNLPAGFTMSLPKNPRAGALRCDRKQDLSEAGSGLEFQWINTYRPCPQARAILSGPGNRTHAIE